MGVDMAARANRTAGAKAAAQGKPQPTPASPKPAQPKPETARPETQGPPPGRGRSGIEAVGLAVAAVFAAISTAAGRSSSPANGAGLTVLVVIVAAGLAAIAVGLAKARPWSRVPAVMAQLFVIIAAVALLDGHHPEWGVPALALAAACLAGLFTPASLRALNRPPGQSPIKTE